VRNLFSRTLELLRPFRRSYTRFLAGTVARQALVVGGGYSLVWALHRSLGKPSIPLWVFITGFLIYDFALLELDLGLSQFFVSRVSFPMFAFLRTKALKKIFEMPQSWHHRQQSGALTGKINDGVGRVVQTAEGFGRELCPAVIQTFLTLIPLLYFSPWTGVFVFFTAVIFVFIALAESRERQPFRKARHDNYAEDFGMFSECIEYVQPVEHFGQTERILGGYGQLQERIATQGIQEIRIGCRYSRKRTLLFAAAKRACQAFWIVQFRDGALDAAMVMYLNMLIEDLFHSFAGYAGLIERLYDGIEPTRTLVGLLEEQPAMSEASGHAVEVPDRIGIEIENVQFSYDSGPPVLQNFSMTVEPGAVVGIVGRSGIGKTTIQQLLSRVYDVQHGSIRIAGKDVREWPLNQLRSLFSSVTQNGGVFFTGASILDTIRFAKPDADLEQVVEAAKCACIHDEILLMPDGYKTPVGPRGVTMSKGQQQRIALAQAVLALHDNRKVLILDEFTSALDSKTEQQVLLNLLPRLKNKTVIVVAHRLATLRKVADRIIVIDENGIAEAGSHAELIQMGGSYSEMAELQTSA